jgi:hypothetical protein
MWVKTGKSSAPASSIFEITMRTAQRLLEEAACSVSLGKIGGSTDRGRLMML